MALWLCAGCSAAYAVGLPACPQCGSTNRSEEGPMPKITVHGGATNDAEPVAPDDSTEAAESTNTPEEESSPGSSSETSSSKPAPSEKPSSSKGRSRARTTENPS